MTRILAPFFFVLMTFSFVSGCTKSYPNCDSDATCAEKGEVCVDGTCRQCSDDSQCQAIGACMTCQANECVKKPNCCTGDFDCPDGACVNGLCEEAQCEVNSDCEEGERCRKGRCVNYIGCQSDLDCEDGLVCRDGECSLQCKLEIVFFDFDEYAVKVDQEKVVQNNVRCLQEGAQSAVIVEGHTDERGNDEYNFALGERRAKSLAAQYRLLGVKNVERVISFGEERPLCTVASENCWGKNRRAETKVK